MIFESPALINDYQMISEDSHIAPPYRDCCEYCNTDFDDEEQLERHTYDCAEEWARQKYESEFELNEDL